MINEAERQGKLAPGGTIIEATAGNTGLGLALIAAQKNYRLILVVPDKMSREKIFHLRALGATVLLTRSDVNKGHPAYYQDYARRLADETPGAFISTSLITTPIRWPMPPPLRRSFISSWRATSTPSSSASAPAVRWAGFRPGLLNTRRKRNLFSPIRRVRSLPIRSIPDATAKRDPGWSKGSAKILSRRWPGWRGAYRVSRQRPRSVPDCAPAAAGRGRAGRLSTGTLLSAALRYCRAQSRPKRVVTFACDSGNKYLSKMFNDDWMRQQGLIARPEQGDLSDFIALRHDEGATVTAAPDDTLAAVFTRMRLYDISQLPVLEDGRVVGIVDEWDLIRHVQGDRQRFSLPVSEAMSRHVETLDKRAPESELQAILDRGLVAVIADNARFLGLVTRSDVLTAWRNRVAQ
jgi:cystathionine beta-synthase